MKRLLTALLFTCIIGISYHSDAAFIETGHYQTDTDTNLDWLDLSATQHRTVGTAMWYLSQPLSIQDYGTGWRQASNDEIVDMFWKFFPNYTSNQLSNDSSYYTDQAHYNEAAYFEDIFGSNNGMSYGRYMDENNIEVNLGARTSSGLQSYIHGTDHEWFSANDSYYCVFVVRETPSAVPIPAAIWLFGTGLIALLGIARRKS